MSLPPGSPEALYHAIPQPDDNPNNDDEAVEPSPQSPAVQAIPVDPQIRWIHFILGCAVLLPFNVIITAMPFFLSRLSTSPLRSAFASYLTTSFTAANFIFLAHATATSKTTSPSKQTRSSIVWLIILNSFLTLTTFFVPRRSIVGAYLQTSTIAVASLFGPPAVQAMMAGQAAVAVAVSGVQVVSAAASVWGKPSTFVSDGSAEERSAFVFFFLSTLFLLMPAYHTVAAGLERGAKKYQSEAGHEREHWANYFRIAKLNMPFEIGVAYVFVVTLARGAFLVFNIGDFLGRYICSYPFFLVWSSKRLLTLSAARTLFIPLFLMCNVQRGASTVPYDPIISSDLLFMIILFLFGGSNGYVSSLCMMAAPSLEHNPRLKGRAEDVDVAATVASFCLVGGLALGSIASFAVKGAICGCNPFTS
ncbi:nucleoside transporter-domain-containing protein [Pholiota molesta]|nr:nucleoside transporter-domain-containing protein [Pholiota molesta]